MAQAEIGALRVRLAMDAGEFRKGVKDVEGMLSRLAGKFGFAAGAGAVAGQLLANSIRNAASSISSSFRGAIDSVGDLVDASSKFGIPVEQLAGLKHAAELSGASFEQLGVGAGKLAKNLTDLAGGGSNPAGKALAALGISATDAAGQVKAVDQVMIELADKFAAVQDGSAKTAIAMQLFGKSGAQLIPTLNLGSAELNRLRDEARRLGLVLDDETARGLEVLGDEWQKVEKRMQGFWIQLTGQLLPALQVLVKDIQNWLDSGGGVTAWARTVGDGIKSVIDWAYSAGAAFERLRVNLSTTGANFADFFGGRWSEIAERNRAAAEEILKIDQKLSEDLKAIWTQHAAEAPGPARPAPGEGGGQGQAPIPDSGAAETARSEAQKLHNDQLDRYLALRRQQMEIEAEIDPITAKLAETQDRLNAAFQKGAIDADQLGIALAKASAVAQNAYAQVAQSIVSDLGTVFQNSKGIAIAQALINTYQSVTNALANVPWPLNIAAAAASLAAGIAQVQNIRSTSKNGGGGGGGSTSATSTGAAASGAGGGPASGQTMFVQGLTGDQLLSGDMVRNIVERLVDFQRDGGKVVLAR